MVDLKNMPKEEIERRRQRAHEGQLEVARVAAGEKPEALSPTMREAMDKAAEHGGKLERMPGGFWIYRGAKLNGVNIAGAEMDKAVGLTQRQLDGACGDEKTQLPPRLHVPACK